MQASPKVGGRSRSTVQAGLPYFVHSKQCCFGSGSCCSSRAETAAAKYYLEVLDCFFSLIPPCWAPAQPLCARFWCKI